MLDLIDMLGTLAKKWDAVLQRPGRWVWQAAFMAIAVGAVAGVLLWLPDNTHGLYRPAFIVVALAATQLFFRVHGPAMITGAAMLAGAAMVSVFFGGEPLDLVTALLVLGAAVLAELSNLFGKTPRWTLSRGVRGALLGGVLFAAAPIFGMDFSALYGGENPAQIAAFLAYAVLAPLIVALCAGLYALVRIVLGAILTAIDKSRSGSAVPAGE